MSVAQPGSVRRLLPSRIAMSVYHDEVEIEDFEYDEETETYTYPCPCGDLFQITKVIVFMRGLWQGNGELHPRG